MLQWSFDKAKDYNAAIKEGWDIPQELLPPDLIEGYEDWFGDFFELSTERQIGMAEGQIPKSAIDRHIEGWHYEDAFVFSCAIREMDALYLSRGSKESDPTPEPEPDPSALRDSWRARTKDLRK